MHEFSASNKIMNSSQIPHQQLYAIAASILRKTGAVPENILPRDKKGYEFDWEIKWNRDDTTWPEVRVQTKPVALMLMKVHCIDRPSSRRRRRWA